MAAVALGVASPSPAVVKKWANTGATATWGASANWSPTGIPTAADDVILDNTTNTGSYIVTSSGAARNCRTLTIGNSAGSANTIELNLNSAGGSATVAGTGNTADTIVTVYSDGKLSHNTSGELIYAANGVALFKNGSTHFMNTTGFTYSTNFPVAGVTYEANATLEWGTGASVTFPISGRTYGNILMRKVSMTTNPSSAATIQGNVTVASGAGPWTINSSAQLNVGGSLISSDAVNVLSVAATPLKFTGSAAIGTNVTVDSNITIGNTGGGLTLTLSSPQTISNGKFVTVPSGNTLSVGSTLAMNGGLQVYNGATMSGAGSLTWGSTGASIGTDLATGFPASALPGVTVSGAYPYPSTIFYEFLSAAAQVAGPDVPNPVNGLLLTGGGTLTVPAADLQVNDTLKVNNNSVLKPATPGFTVTLGTSTANIGTFSFGNGGRIDKDFSVKRWFSTSSTGRDYPLAHSGSDRILSLAGMTIGTGGTLKTQFIPSNPGGGPININADSKTYTNVAPDGYFVVTAGDGIAVTSYDIEAQCAGFNAVGDGLGVTLAKRNSVGPGAWGIEGTIGTATAGRTSSFKRTGITTGFSDFGFAGTATYLPVSLSGFCIE